MSSTDHKTLAKKEDPIAELLAEIESLRRERDQYKACFENAPSGILLQTLDGIIIDVNPAQCEPRGWTREEIIGKHISSVAHQDIRWKVEENLERIRSGEVLRHTVRSETKTGKVLYSALNESRIELGEEREGILVMSVDVTELKRKEQELQVSEKRNKAMIHAIPDMLFRMNRNGDYLELHPGEHKLVAEDPKELVGKNIRDFKFPPKIIDDGLSAINRALDEQQLVTLNYDLEALGQHHYFEARIVPIDKNEILEIVRDVTHEKKHEEELKDALHVAEEAAKAKANFLANMSHEIRTPLNGVIGVADLLSESTLHPDQLELLRIIQESSAILLELISDILDFSRIDAGKIELELFKFSLRSAVNSAVLICSPKAKYKGLDLITNYDSAIEREVIGDPTRLRQILMNLISNGIKFTENGSVTLTIEETKSTDNEIWLKFQVQDTGLGVSPEGQKRIFNAFAQEQSSTNREYGGTGLGLTISKSLVELMGGELTVESELGVGSTFSFEVPFATIPLSKDRHIFSDMTRYQNSSFSEFSFLIVDDNQINQKVIVKLLNSLGAEKIQCEDNGKSAYEKCCSEKYDVILMDCQMPVMDGFQTTQSIRENSLNKKSVIIALTANALKGTEEQCLSVGMNAFLTKPVRKADLKQKIISEIAKT